MKIIILNDYAYINGGAGNVAISSAVALANKGYKTLLFTAVGPIDIHLKAIKNLEVVCLEQYDILNNPNRLKAVIDGIWNFKSAKIFRELLNRFNCTDTVIHVHSCAKGLSGSCIHVAIKKKFKVIFHLHDYGIVCPNMGFFNYPKQKKCLFTPLTYQCILSNCDSRSYFHKIWRCLRQFFQIQVGKVPSKIITFIAVSKFSYDILEKYLPLEVKSIIISNPIKINKSERIKAEKNKTVLFIGRLSKEKNPLILARVAKELELSVIFIGSGPCEDEIRNIYPESVLTGWIDEKKVNQYLQEARCLVFPSIWYECQPLAVLESLGKGVPVIVSDACAAQESFVNKEEGFLFKSNDEDSLKETLIKFQDDDMVQQLSCNAYKKYWSEDHSLDAYIIRLLEVYKSILKNDHNV